MRAVLSTIQQTLTPEATAVLNNSIEEAARRNHGQTTPVHVAATLLSSPSGLLRQACIKSHPNSSHPLQCRALELCFSVALERLPTPQNLSPGVEPSISNALMAALKRAQAHQRRGCPEQQQQPLLAVKVELEQLIVSILDDPSVSRVMREASFSSPAVKATIEQSLNVAVATSSPIQLGLQSSMPIPIPRPSISIPSPVNRNLYVNPRLLQQTSLDQSGNQRNEEVSRVLSIPVSSPVNRNLYVNPRLQQQTSLDQSGDQRNEEVNRVFDILLRTKKRNPILVGGSELDTVLKELFRRIEDRKTENGPLKNVQLVHVSDNPDIPSKMKELEGLIDEQMSKLENGGLILDLGDLKWLVEQPTGIGVPGLGLGLVQVQMQKQHIVSEAGLAAVVEIGKLLAKFMGRIWLIGTATCETYLRCQVYYPTMENVLDLQAVPITARAPRPGMFPRLGNERILGKSVEPFSLLKGLQNTFSLTKPIPESTDPAQKLSCCSKCMENYEQEVEKLRTEDLEKTSSEEKLEVGRPPLPQWLHNARALDQTQTKNDESITKQKSSELLKKWSDTCLRLHLNFHQHLSNNNLDRIAPNFSSTSLYNPNLPVQRTVQKNKNVGETLRLDSNPVCARPSQHIVSPPGSPVKTDLVLGHPNFNEMTTSDFLGSKQYDRSPFQQQSETPFGSLDIDSFKKLLKGLTESVSWQREATSAVATIMTEYKIGNRRQRGGTSKGDIWLLFAGPDRVGKKKMVFALSEILCGANPVTIGFGSNRDGRDTNSRGKTVLDQIVEAIKKNPFSVIMLEDIDKADMLVRGSIKRAIERGRISDSYGREISLGNVVFILTTSDTSLDEKRLATLSSGGWQLKICCIQENKNNTTKRRPSWLSDEERSTKLRKEAELARGFDLNETAGKEDEKGDGSYDSSDLTFDHEDENIFRSCKLLQSTTSSVPHELLTSVDNTIIFTPVDFAAVRSGIASSLKKKFSAIVDGQVSIKIDDIALEKIVGGVWLGRTGIEEWTEKVVVTSLNEVKSRFLTSSTRMDTSTVIRLECDGTCGCRSCGDLLPSYINVAMELEGL